MRSNNERRPVLSDRYQEVFYEIGYDTAQLIQFTNDDALHTNEYDEKLLDIKELIRLEFWILAEKICTSLQLKVLQGISNGRTQKELAESLGCNQSSIQKCLNGNTQYYNGKDQKFGGVIKKLKRHIANSIIFNELFNKIEELNNI